LVPIGTRQKKRVLGSAKGEFTVPDDFNDPLPKEIEDLFW
jgi:antitoxin (DNA-binding transcriptional repressor) of toxin-antitoxin stability system